MAKKLPYEEFKSIYARVPRLCVDLILKNEDGILLTQRNIEPGKGLWHLPGGTLLLGESIDEAIKRILQEELSVVPENYRLVGTIEFNNTDNLFFHAVSIAYLIENFNGEIKGSWQGEKVGFFNPLPENTVVEHKQFLEELL